MCSCLVLRGGSVTEVRRTYYAGIYARLSVDSHNEKNESVENQIAAAMAFMEKYPELVLFDCYVDLGKTGTSFFREGFMRLMQDVRLGKVNCILVKDFSRFGRNYIETGNYIQKIFPFLGVRFISVADSFDSLYSDKDALSVNLINLANELYARDISVKVQSSRRLLAGSGSFAGGNAPYGYRLCILDGRRGLVIDGDASEVVKSIYRLWNGGESLTKICRYLFEDRIHRPKEYRRYNHVSAREGEALLEWSCGSIRSILLNEVYVGKERWTAGAIVTQEQFEEAVRRLEERKRVSKREGNLQTYESRDFLEGLLFCGSCGRKMGKRRYAKKELCGSGSRAYGYFCRYSTRIDDRFCERKYINGLRMEELVRGSVEIMFLLEMESGGLKSRIEEVQKGREKFWKKRLNKIKSDMEEVRKKGSRLYQRYREGAADQSEFFRWKKESGERLRELAEKRERVKETQQRELRKLERKARLLRNLDSPAVLARMDRELAGALIERISVYENKRMEIVFRFRNFNQAPHTD